MQKNPDIEVIELQQQMIPSNSLPYRPRISFKNLSLENEEKRPIWNRFFGPSVFFNGPYRDG